MYLRLDLYKFPPNHPVEPLGMYKNDPIVREQPEYIRSRHQNRGPLSAGQSSRYDLQIVVLID